MIPIIHYFYCQIDTHIIQYFYHQIDEKSVYFYPHSNKTQMRYTQVISLDTIPGIHEQYAQLLVFLSNF